MSPELKLVVEDFMIRWGQHVPPDQRKEFYDHLTMVCAACMKDSMNAVEDHLKSLASRASK